VACRFHFPCFIRLHGQAPDPALARLLTINGTLTHRGGSAACDCADRAGLNSSSRWQRSLRTSAGWPSSWHGPLRSRPHAWRERQVIPKSRWQSLE
jgi:hypothetical protein